MLLEGGGDCPILLYNFREGESAQTLYNVMWGREGAPKLEKMRYIICGRPLSGIVRFQFNGEQQGSYEVTRWYSCPCPI
jgi:hypothetical protein